jgi:hypothetical protein
MTTAPAMPITARWQTSPMSSERKLAIAVGVLGASFV